MTEEWRPIPAFPYEASSHGRIRRADTGRVLRANAWRAGYLQVSLWREGVGYTCKVHRLVCLAFHGTEPRPKMDAAHRNGVKDDNRPENLRWATRRENEHDKRAHGRDNAGVRNGQAKLTAAAVREIRARVSALPRSAGGGRIRKGALGALAATYGVRQAAVKNILAGTHWRGV